MLVALDETGSERVQPKGRGHWMWRYSFDHAGLWQIRLIADLRNAEGQWKATGEWQAVTVTHGPEKPTTAHNPKR